MVKNVFISSRDKFGEMSEDFVFVRPREWSSDQSREDLVIELRPWRRYLSLATSTS